MPKSAREVLLSYPIPVRFAGFQSTTAQLQEAGWDISLREEITCERTVSIIMQYERGGIYGVSQSINYIAMELLYSMEKGNLEPLKALCFDIQYIGSGVQFYRIPIVGNSFLADFRPIDASPQMTTIEHPEDFSLFKKVDPSKDVLIDPNDVPGLMEMILKAQKPQQEMLRARERSRKNLEKWRQAQTGSYNNSMNFKPATEVQANLITLVG